MSRPSLSGIWGVRETLEPLNSKDSSQRKPYCPPSNAQKSWGINTGDFTPSQSEAIEFVISTTIINVIHVYSPFHSWGFLLYSRTEHAHLNPKIDSDRMINFCFCLLIIIMSDLYVFQRDRPKTLINSQK